MTLALYNEQRQAPLEAWANSARQAGQIAQSLAKTPFVPKSLRDRDPDVTAANVTAVLLLGAEVGLQPMAALRSIDLIEGTPALRAVVMRAIVQAAGHDIWVEESTETRAIVAGVRKGSSQVQRSVWVHDRAKKLGLTNKANWRNQPGSMLVARATGECCRWVASDALMGLQYAQEELEDGDAVPALQPAIDTVTEGPARTAQRKTRRQIKPVVTGPSTDDIELERPPAPPLVPPADETTGEVEVADDPEPTQMPITQAQMKAMQAGFTDLGITDRDARLSVVTTVIGRDITSSKELSADEASRVIDQLRRANEMTDPADWITQPTLDDTEDPEEDQ